MRRIEIATGPRGRIVLRDSIATLDESDTGAIVVSGSHGGTSAAEFAIGIDVPLVVFNDAGVGKDAAGIAGLRLLQDYGRAAATVTHTSARIGDAMDTWEHGVVSHVNAHAAKLGLAPGQPLRQALLDLIG